jgi:hypothetical protein
MCGDTEHDPGLFVYKKDAVNPQGKEEEEKEVKIMKS